MSTPTWYTITGHPPAKRREIRRRLQTKAPATARLLDDPGFRALVAGFPGCEVDVDISEITQETPDVRQPDEP